MKTGIVGFGVIAAVHKNSIDNLENVELAAICDIDPEKKKLVGDIPFYTDVGEMLSKEQLECVHICLPHYLHVPMTLKCAQKGCNVFVEKPIGLTYDQVSELHQIEEKYGIKVGVCLQNRYNATTVCAKKIFENKEFGEFLGSRGIVTWCRKEEYYKAGPWRGIREYSGGGVMINQALHTLDLLSYIGGKIYAIDGKISNFSLKQYDIEDTVMARMQYENKNAAAVFFATIGYCENVKPLLEFVFEKAVLRISDGKLYQLDKNYREEICLCRDETRYGEKGYYGASHYAAIEAFYQAVRGNTKNYISVNDAAEVIRLIDGIMESSRTNVTILNE